MTAMEMDSPSTCRQLILAFWYGARSGAPCARASPIQPLAPRPAAPRAAAWPMNFRRDAGAAPGAADLFFIAVSLVLVDSHAIDYMARQSSSGRTGCHAPALRDFPAASRQLPGAAAGYIARQCRPVLQTIT